MDKTAEDFYLSLHYDCLDDSEKSLEHYIQGVLHILNSKKTIDRSISFRLEVLFCKRMLRLQRALARIQDMNDFMFDEGKMELLVKHERAVYKEVLITLDNAVRLFKTIRFKVVIEKYELFAYIIKVEADFLRRKLFFQGSLHDPGMKIKTMNLYKQALSLLEENPYNCPYRLDVVFNYSKYLITCYDDHSNIQSLTKAFTESRKLFTEDFAEETRYYWHIMSIISSYLDKLKGTPTVSFDGWLCGNAETINVTVSTREDFFVLYTEF